MVADANDTITDVADKLQTAVGGSSTAGDSLVAIANASGVTVAVQVIAAPAKTPASTYITPSSATATTLDLNAGAPLFNSTVVSGWTVLLAPTAESFAVLYTDLATADVDGLGAALAAKINLNATVHAEYLAASDKLVIVREGGTAITATLTENRIASATVTGANGNAHSVDLVLSSLKGTVGITTGWTLAAPGVSSVTVNVNETQGTFTANSLDGFGGALAFKLNANAGFRAAFSAAYVASSDTLTITKASPGNFDTTGVVLTENRVASADRTVAGSANAALITFSGTPLRAGNVGIRPERRHDPDARREDHHGGRDDCPAGSTGLVEQIATLAVFNGSPYEAFRVTGTAKLVVYRTDSTSISVASQVITTPAIDSAVAITVSGTPVRVWQTIVTPDATIALDTAGVNVGKDDLWTLKVNGTSQTPFKVNTETTMTQVAAGIAGTVGVAGVSAIGSSADGGAHRVQRREPGSDCGRAAQAGARRPPTTRRWRRSRRRPRPTRTTRA